MLIKKKLYLFIILVFGCFGVHKLYSKGFERGLGYVMVYTGLLFVGISPFFAMAEFLGVLLLKPAVNGYITVY